jgi:hypothetical protein
MRSDLNEIVAANSSQMGSSKLENSAISGKADLMGKVLLPLLEQVAESEEKEVLLQDDKGNIFRLSMLPKQAEPETKNEPEKIKEKEQTEYYDEEYASYESEEEKTQNK